MAAAILLIEDDPETAQLVADTLRNEAERFDVVTVPSGRLGLHYLATRTTDCVLLDYRLPDVTGLDVLRTLRKRDPDLAVVIVTAQGSQEVAVEAMKLGATDYMVKDEKYLRTVGVVVREALGRRQLERLSPRKAGTLASTARQVTRLRRDLRERYRLDGLIGESEAMERTLALAERAAQSRVTVLLEGETGTGKELIARAIHRRGPRARGPFLAQNCAALPETLLESELFGHVRSAFTGADRERPGLFVEASGGTLFLDEVSETSDSFQAKLLRVLQDGIVRPIGSSVTRTTDTRIIAATNRDLRELANEGRFRMDLLYRLQVFPIRLPALRERREDIKPLALYFLDVFCEQEGKSVPGLEPETFRRLEDYSWPGNVRELQNEIHRLVLCSEPNQRLGPDLLSNRIAGGASNPPTHGQPLKEIVRAVELATIRTRLREHGYRRSATARSLGITRETLWIKLRQLGVMTARRVNGVKE